MTMPIQFDTLEYAKTLQAAGIPQDQAEAHAQALTTALSGAVVVPSEMVLLKADLLARMDLLRLELETRMDAIKHDLEARMDAIKRELDSRLDALELRIGNSFRTLRWLVATSLLCNFATLGALAMLLLRH